VEDVEGEVIRKKSQKARESGEEMDCSVVVPISERHDDLAEIHELFSKELDAEGLRFEFIFVLDGVQKEARATLNALRLKAAEVKVISLNRAFGEATALSIGFESARGPLIITLSPYFQVEPCELGKVLQALEDGGHDLVITRRHPRIDACFNRLQSVVFHWVTRALTGTKYHDISCGLRVLKRKVAEEVPLYGDLHRFFPLLAYQRGFRVAEVPVRQSPHDSKTRISRPGVYLRRLLDILTLFFLFKFTKKPLRFFGLLGTSLAGGGGLTLSYLAFYKLIGLGGIAGRPLLILGVLLVVLGVQFFSIGLLGEIIIFTHATETKDYQIKEVLGEG